MPLSCYGALFNYRMTTLETLGVGLTWQRPCHGWIRRKQKFCKRIVEQLSFYHKKAALESRMMNGDANAVKHSPIGICSSLRIKRRRLFDHVEAKVQEGLKGTNPKYGLSSGMWLAYIHPLCHEVPLVPPVSLVRVCCERHGVLLAMGPGAGSLSESRLCRPAPEPRR